MEFIIRVSEDTNGYELMNTKIDDEDIYIQTSKFRVSYHKNGGFFYNEIYGHLLTQQRIDWNVSHNIRNYEMTEQQLYRIDDRKPYINDIRHEFVGFSYNCRTKTVSIVE